MPKVPKIVKKEEKKNIWRSLLTPSLLLPAYPILWFLDFRPQGPPRSLESKETSSHRAAVESASRCLPTDRTLVTRRKGQTSSKAVVSDRVSPFHFPLSSFFIVPFLCLAANQTRQRRPLDETLEKEMASCRTSFVSILNNDDNPSFAVRSAPILSRHHSSPSCPYQTEHQHPPAHDYRSNVNVYPDSPAVSPRMMRRPFDPVSEAVQHPTSPGSSDSSHDYMANPHAAFYPQQHSRQDFYAYPPTMLPSERRLSMPSPAEPPSPQTSLSGSRDSTQTRGSRKNKYPCPYAASHSCTATFTTSGHAARHGKKHTGEKSVHCPICNKAFTRKDNMKQHIRTHRTHSEDSQSGLVRDANAAYSPSHGHNRSISQSRVDRNVYQNVPSLPRGGHHQIPY